MKTMQAKYPGRCARTGAAIRPGDAIEWHGRGRAVLIVDTVDGAQAHAQALDPDMDPESAQAAGRYLARSMARGVSDIWSTGGREYYRNKAGRCEDAPCCGCCNA